MKEKTAKKLSVLEICLKFKFNQNTKDYLVAKYGDNSYTETEWKGNFKKDGLNF